MHGEIEVERNDVKYKFGKVRLLHPTKIEKIVEVEKKDEKYKITKGKVEWRSATPRELMHVITLFDYGKDRKALYEVMGVRFKLKYPERDWNKFKRFFEIAGSLPCTIFVLSKRTGVSKPTAYSYLSKLLAWGIIKKMLDVECEQWKYYLNDEYVNAEKLRDAILMRLNAKVKVFKRGKPLTMKDEKKSLLEKPSG